MSSFDAFFLHGFLGQSEDWDCFINLNSSLNNFCAPDFLSKKKELFDPCMSFSECARAINILAKKKLKSPRVLFGYSLGGRLARHVVLDDPSIWSAVVFLSTQIGLPQEKWENRKKWEENWKDVFLTDPWSHALKAWNDLQIFKTDSFVLRKEEDFSRKKLAESLTSWSMRSHSLSREEFMDISIPSLWLYGKDDSRCKSTVKELSSFFSQSPYEFKKKPIVFREIRVLERRGHRLLAHSQDVLQALESSNLLKMF